MQDGPRATRGDPDPYPNYRWLREHQPASVVPGSDGKPLCVVTSYELVRSCLLDPRLRSGYEPSARPGGTADADAPSRTDGMALGISEHYHERVYRIMSEVLPSSLVERTRPGIQASCRSALSAFIARGHADLMGEYALRIPVAVIHDLLGVPKDEREAPEVCLREYLAAGFTSPPDAESEEFLHDYVHRIIGYKRAHPGDDVTTRLIDYLDRGELHSVGELQTVIFTLLGAGHTTTAPFIATAIVRLLEHPACLNSAMQDEGRWPAIAEEVLRHDAPLHSVQTRYAQQEMVIGDVQLEPGHAVLLSLAAANRDPSRFVDPEEFDPDRPVSRHLAFGHGSHFCPGSQLARSEGRIALRELFHAIPDLSLSVGSQEIVWAFGPILRGPATIPVIFTPQQDSV
jgi:cytochrome P450